MRKTPHQQKIKKKKHVKQPCTIKEASKEQEGEEKGVDQGVEDTGNEIVEDIPPLDPITEVFTHILTKGGQGGILKGDSGLANSIVTMGLLKAIILPQD